MGTSKKQKSLRNVYPEVPDKLPHGIIDNHTHIDLADFFEIKNPLTIDGHLKYNEHANIVGIVQSGTTLDSSIYACDIANKYKEVKASIGIHPNEAPGIIKNKQFGEQIQKIYDLAKNNEQVRGIGETGLDFFRTPNENDQKAQQESFVKHIEIAKELNLPMQIHDRDAHKSILEILKKVGAPKKTVFHCFSGDTEMAKLVTSKGAFISFAGNITYNANEYLRNALLSVPLEKVLIETDAPFLTPVPYRGRPNISYLTNIIARFIADVLALDLEKLCKQLYKNTIDVYGKW
jgi:TatD DNase family protein